MVEAIKNFIFVQLKPKELEKSFRIESFKRDKTLTIIVMIITLILIIMFVGLDISLLPENIIHPLWIPSRIVASIASIIGVWIVRRQSRPRLLNQIAFVWGLIIICHLLIVNMTRPNDYISVITWDIFTLFGIYFLIPYPFHYKIISAFFLTASSGAIWCIYRIPLVDSYETVAVLAAYFITNVYGVFVSRRDNQVRRQHHVLLLKEMKTRRDLSDRTTELEKAQKELRKLAMTDFLTGISNRRHFLNQLPIELDRTKRYGNPLSIMIFDLDNLKDINDKYGHDSGDELIRSFGKHCSSELRSIDQFARFGGDEFIALLPQTDRDEVKEVAERIRTLIEDLEIRFGQEVFNTTVSIGLTTTTDGEISVEEFIKRADKALYDAKNNGKNQVAYL